MPIPPRCAAVRRGQVREAVGDHADAHQILTDLSGLRRPRRRVGQQQRLQPILAVGIRRRARGHRLDERVQLRAIGSRIALEEERQCRIGGEAGTVRQLDRRRSDVAGAQQALRAMRLDALVIAVGGTTGIGDLAQPAARGSQRRHGGIHISGGADRRVHQARGGGVHEHRFLAQQEARHIEVVDHHVAEQAARRSDIGWRRRRRITADDGEQLERTDLAGVHPPLQRGEVHVEAAIEADHQRHARPLHGIEARAHAIGGQVDRLLAEDRLAGRGSALDVVDVGRRRRTDQHGVGGKRLVQRQGARPTRLGQARRRRCVDIGHAGQPCTGMRGDVARVDVADAPGTYHGNAQHRSASPSPLWRGTIATVAGGRETWRRCD